MDTKTPLTTERDDPDDQSESEGLTMDAALLRLRDLLTGSDIATARALVQEMAQRWPEEEEVRYWARVLAPPRVTVEPSRPRRSLERERAWLRQNAGNYAGCWLAVNGDTLVSADPDLALVLAKALQTPGAEQSLIHYEPA